MYWRSTNRDEVTCKFCIKYVHAPTKHLIAIIVESYGQTTWVSGLAFKGF